MAQPTQPIYTDNPGALPAEYVLPAGLDLDLQSIVARIDGAGAAGSFRPAIDVLTQDGRLVYRVPADTTYAPGDTGVVTWSPFLAQAKAAGPTPGATLKAIRMWTANMNLTVGDANDNRLSWDNVSSFDATVFGTSTFGGRFIRQRWLKKGWYATFLWFVWTTSFITGNMAIHCIFVGDTLSGASYNSPNDFNGDHLGTRPFASFTRYIPDEFDALPAVLEWWVGQNSGANRVINEAVWQTVYLGDSDF